MQLTVEDECGIGMGALGFMVKGAAGDALLPTVRSAPRDQRDVGPGVNLDDGTTTPGEES